MENGKRSKMLANEKIGKLLYKLSLPSILGMLVQALYNIVDTIFVGKGVGTLAIGSIAIAFPIQMLIMSFGQTIGIGSASRISRRMGQGDREGTAQTLGNGIILAEIIGISVLVIGTLAIVPLLRFFGATDAMMPYALDYFQVILLAAPFITLTMLGNDSARAEGNAKIAMTAMFIGAGLNIILDPIFIFALDMGIRGAAIATAISMAISCIFLFTYFLSGKSEIPIGLRYLRLKGNIIREILAVGSSSLAMAGAMSLTMALVFNTLKSFGGAVEIAAFGIIHRVFSLIFMPVIGLAQGMQPIIGFNYGAKQFHRVKSGVKLTALVATLIATTGFFMIMLFPDIIIRTFSNDPDLIRVGREALRYCILALPLAGLQIIGGGFFQALGRPLSALLLTLSRQVLILIPLMAILPRIIGLTGVWLSFPAADCTSFFITSVFVLRALRKLTASGEKNVQITHAEVATENNA